MKLVKFLTAIVLLSAVFIVSCSDDKVTQNKDLTYFCDLETIEGDFFVSESGKFKNAFTVSNEKAFSGKNSSKINVETEFGVAFQFKNVKKGELINATVWIWRDKNSTSGDIVISNATADLYDNQSYIIDKKKGWIQIQNTYRATADEDVMKVYMHNPRKDDVYYDDLRITRVVSVAQPPITDSTLRIFIPEQNMNKLDSFIRIAVENDIITDNLKKYVGGFLIMNGDSLPVDLRLKGDWADHLKTEKYSLRVRLTGDDSYNGLKTFSIQNPETRSLLMEWYIHELCAYEDVLAPRYDFVTVEINGKNMGVYALEEHFEKQLVEAKNRREGPIMKLDETGFWQINHDLKKGLPELRSPAFEAAPPVAFKAKRIYKNANLKNQFLVAQGHLDRYKNLDPRSEEFLDLELFAKYLGITDIGGIEHSLIWHNQRQYFNPLTNKLEPIAYDAFQGLDLLSRRSLFFGVLKTDRLRRPTHVNLPLMNNKKFTDLYVAFLKKVTAEGYLEEFNKTIQSELDKYQELLSYEYPFYSFDQEWFDKSIRLMRKDFYKLEEFIEKGEKFEFAQDVWEPFPDTLALYRPDVALQVYLKSAGEINKTLTIGNYHLSDVEVLGHSNYIFPDKIIPFDKPLSFPYFSTDANFTEVSVPSDTEFIHYTAKNLNGQVMRTKISKWPKPEFINVLGEHDIIGSDGEHTIKAGNYTFTKNQVFNGSKLIIEAGTHIDLRETAGFISHAPVELRGTADNPIVIISSDFTGSGFNVITSSGKTVMNHVKFDNLNAMNKNHWILTGAVTVYGHEVEITNCSFDNNHCEDGLNIIRSNFLVDNCSITNTYSDGFDADFCTGTLSNSSFEATGNDAIDFSGSVLNISRCKISGAGDKGISGGENSQLVITDCEVDGATMGVASKDLSHLDISNITLHKCKYGFAAFIKKPEYGPASITVKSSTESNVATQILIDLNSTIEIDGTVTKGTERIDVEALYVGFEK